MILFYQICAARGRRWSATTSRLGRWKRLPHYNGGGVVFCVTESVPAMKHSIERRTIRRSVALPGSLVEELCALAPAELGGNWNRLVIVALREYAARRRAHAFESQMAAMAGDPGVQAECAMIAKEFCVADMDGLRHD